MLNCNVACNKRTAPPLAVLAGAGFITDGDVEAYIILIHNHHLCRPKLGSRNCSAKGCHAQQASASGWSIGARAGYHCPSLKCHAAAPGSMEGLCQGATQITRQSLERVTLASHPSAHTRA